MTQTLYFDNALLPDGWAHAVRVTIENGIIQTVVRNATPADSLPYDGIALPGLPNLHCHAFQRAMAGLAERRGPTRDSFWTWREVMYRFLATLSPDDVEAIAAFAYMEMLECGFTTVAEFHYLHHDPTGRPYSDLGEMAMRIAAAAAESGIGLTLLPSLYMTGGLGGTLPTAGQKRFLNDTDRFLALVERARTATATLPDARVGIAPHSLRAVPPGALAEVLAEYRQGPVHIHAAEQVKEVEDSVAVLGAPPVEWLLDHVDVDSRWCLIHCTHMTPAETRRLAGTGAVAGLCPLTEASLGDGIFDGARYLECGGRFAIGTDSNIQIDVAAELRQLEYGQRLNLRARNVITLEELPSVGRSLVQSSLAGGAQACAQPVGAIEPGRRGDIIVLDKKCPDLAIGEGDRWLDAWLFVVGRSAVQTVLVGGTPLVVDGRHCKRDAIAKRYSQAISRLSDC